MDGMQLAWSGLLRSRKFLVLLLDVLLSTILFFVGKYVPSYLEDVKFLIGVYQPLFLLIIAAITAEDSAEKLGKTRARK